MDDSVTLSKDRAVRLADLMAEIGLPWRTQTRADDLCRRPELAEYFKQHGCTQLTFGAESGSPKILLAMKKHVTVEQIRQAVDILNAASVPYTANFMIGYPGETDADAALTVELIHQLAPRRVLAGSVVPYPGTESVRYLPRPHRGRPALAVLPLVALRPGLPLRRARQPRRRPAGREGQGVLRPGRVPQRPRPHAGNVYHDLPRREREGVGFPICNRSRVARKKGKSGALSIHHSGFLE